MIDFNRLTDYTQTILFASQQVMARMGSHLQGIITQTLVPRVTGRGRIAAFEILEVKDEIKDLIVRDASSIEIKKRALELGYKPFCVDAVNKVIEGVTTLDEINRQLIIY